MELTSQIVRHTGNFIRISRSTGLELVEISSSKTGAAVDESSIEVSTTGKQFNVKPPTTRF